MIIRVLFFASVKEKAGIGCMQVDLATGATLQDLRQYLEDKLPGLQPYLASSIFSINREFADLTAVIPEGAEVAVFPPVSGGSGLPTICLLTSEVVDTDQLVAQITLPGSGAACIFTGIVRAETTRGGEFKTSALEYEAYAPMAEEKMHQVAEEIRARWPEVQGIAVVQRIGRFEAGQLTTWVACTAGHRDTGVFEAARYGIDRLKEIVPVWKKEIGPQGETWVDGSYHPVQG